LLVRLFAPATSGGGIAIFNNSMRLSSSKILDNTQFLKSAGGLKQQKKYPQIR
jgi:hypothetical protein